MNKENIKARLQILLERYNQTTRFDELYQRIIDLITILSENTEQEIEPSSQNGNEEYPF